jgi:hypothetical protein
MTHRFTTKYGRNLEIDLSKWKIDKNSRNCEIIEISEDYLLLENKYKDRFSIPEHIIKANNYNIVDNTIVLSEGLYENYFLNKFKSESQSQLDILFEKYASIIFQNRTVVLNMAEYYLLKPRILSTGFMYTGGKTYTLGNLVESFESGNHIYYDEFCGYEKMFLISMAASPLSGTIFNAIFWSDKTNEFVRFNSESKWPKYFNTSVGWSLFNMLKSEDIKIDRQDIAIKKLINEINAAER